MEFTGVIDCFQHKPNLPAGLPAGEGQAGENIGVFWQVLFFSCKGRVRTFKEGLAPNPIIMRIRNLFPGLHPRDRRACLPVSSPYSVLF